MLVSIPQNFSELNKAKFGTISVDICNLQYLCMTFSISEDLHACWNNRVALLIDLLRKKNTAKWLVDLVDKVKQTA